MTLDELCSEIARAAALPPLDGARRLRELVDVAKAALSSAADERVYDATTRGATNVGIAARLGVSEGAVRKALRRHAGGAE